MLLSELKITENRIKALEKKGICSVEDVQRFFPRKYYDFSRQAELMPLNHNQYITIIGTLASVNTDKKNETLMLKAKVEDERTGKRLNVLWIGSYYLKKIIEQWEGARVIVCGKMTYFGEYHSFHMSNPIVFSKDVERNLRVYPVYSKMKGISEEFMEECIKKALLVDIEETVPEKYITKWRLMSLKTAIQTLHKPTNMELLKKAQQRIIYDKMLEFAISVEKEELNASPGTSYNIKSLKNTNDYIASLPYSLTPSQKSVFDDMKKTAFDGRRIKALLQGDVGSGKTTSAFLAMFAMADSGYQSVILAPTQILAKQHFDKLEECATKYDYKTAFLSGETKPKEKRQILEGIRTGEITFVVGTHAVINPDIEYKCLALAIIDEEHRFGVAQRNMLFERAKTGTHVISMSATPIPRTIASTLYGTNTKVYDLEQPSNRKPVQSTVFCNKEKIYEFIYKKILEKQQAYVVCPWIDDAGEHPEIATVEGTKKQYEEYFKRYPDVKIGCVTGKMKPQEVNETVGEFAAGKIHILISTTVIEVGVNVPNANVIVIQNAERFGLAQLHQLRGRVGRGSQQGYCIFNSMDKENPRLAIMCKTTNGYEIAEEDMKLRGTGDVLGTDQSGKNEFIDLILRYPNMYQKVKEDAKEIVFS